MMIRTALRALPSSSLHAPIVSRAFATSASALFATPTEGAPSAGKSPQMKEFKIYRWVSLDSNSKALGKLLHAALTFL